MKKITLIANLLLILFLFIVPQFIGKSPKTSIEQRIVVELSYLTNDLMTDELNNLKYEIINNTKMSDKKIIELTQNLKTSLNSTLNNIYIYQDLVKNNSYNDNNLQILNEAENLIINIDEHLNTICSLNKLNNKDYIKNIFDDIDTLNKSFKSLKQQFSQDNICI